MLVSSGVTWTTAVIRQQAQTGWSRLASVTRLSNGAGPVSPSDKVLHK